MMGQTLRLNLSLMSERPAAAVHPEIWALSALVDAAEGRGDLGSGPPTPTLALGVSGGAGLLAVAFRDRRAGSSTLHLTGWNPFQTTLLGGLERLGAHAIVRESGRRRKAARHLDEALAGGTPVAAWVDGATLGVQPTVLRGMSPTVVVAADAGSGQVRVGDGRTELTVERALLDEARHASGAHRTRLVTLAPGAFDHAAVVTRRGLATTAVGPVGGPPGASGADGLRALAALLADPEERAEVFPDAAAQTGALVALHAAVASEDALLRTAQAEFVGHAAVVLETDALREIAAAQQTLADDWAAVAAAALPADVPELAALRTVPSAHALPADVGASFPLAPGETAELFGALAARLTALADAEERALEALRTVLRAA